MKNKLKKSNNSIFFEFSTNLQKAVTDTGLTPYALAKKIGVDRQAISRLLKGDRDPNLSTVIRIAKGMQVSMDQLLGLIPVKSTTKKVEIKKENLNLIDKISTLHEQDVELLEAIVDVLEKRRARTMAKFLNAIRDAKSPTKNKENPMDKTAEKVRKKQTSKVSFGSDNDEDDFEDGFDDFEEDSDTSESDDFDEDDESDDYDEDDDYEEDDDYDEAEEEDDLGDGHDDDIDYDEFH